MEFKTLEIVFTGGAAWLILEEAEGQELLYQ